MPTRNNPDSDTEGTQSNLPDDCYENGDRHERRELRHKLRDLMVETQSKRQDLVEPSTCPEDDDLLSILQRQNDLFDQVRHTREAALDSTQLATVAYLAQVKALNLEKSAFREFHANEFVQKLMRFVRGQQASPPDQELEGGFTPRQWEVLGEGAQIFFNRSPPLTYMYGSFEKGPTQPKERKARSEQKRDARDKPQQVANIDPAEMQNMETTSQEAEKILEILQDLYVKTNGDPICFFEFVLNNEDFGQTIENIFYVSFLARDGFVKVYLDDAKLPVIEPVQMTEEKKQELSTQKKHQVVIKISYGEWKELIKTFDIANPLIPTRKAVHKQQQNTASKKVKAADTRGEAGGRGPLSEIQEAS